MATGTKAFAGESHASLIGAILKDEPRPVSALQPLSPPGFDALIATCLAKDPDERWLSAADVARQPRLLRARRRNRRRRAWRRSARRDTARAGPGPSRSALSGSASRSRAPASTTSVSLSADGKRVAFRRADSPLIQIRDLDEFDARAVPGTADASLVPCFSPDGERIPPSPCAGVRWYRCAVTTRLVVILLAAAVARPLAAHPAPFSYLDLRLDADATRGVLVVHDYDAAHELGIDDPERLLDPRVASERADELVAILADRLHLSLDGEAASPHWRGVQVLVDRQSLRFEFFVPTSKPGRIDLDAVLFPYDGVHQTFVNVYEGQTLEQQAILDARNHGLTWYSGSVQGRFAVIAAFVKSGIEHILIGPDHLLFLLGLLLLGGSIWRLATIVTAFTVGHSVTLSLAALDVVQASPRIVEPAIALTIVVVGVDNLLARAGAGAPQAGPPARDLRPWLAGAFGLIHGFGFASVLREIGLPPAALAWSLVSFNVGVEIGQLAAVAVMVAVLAAVRRYDVAWAQRVAVAGSTAVVAAGLFWFVERMWFSAA